jgi:hypothetical protein
MEGTAGDEGPAIENGMTFLSDDEVLDILTVV